MSMRKQKPKKNYPVDEKDYSVSSYLSTDEDEAAYIDEQLDTEYFCYDCPAIYEKAYNEVFRSWSPKKIKIQGEACPADFNPNHRNCIKYNEYKNLLKRKYILQEQIHE